MCRNHFKEIVLLSVDKNNRKKEDSLLVHIHLHLHAVDMLGFPEKKAKDLKAMNYINQRTQNCVEHLAFFPSINSFDSRETFSHDCFACYFGVWISCNTLTHSHKSFYTMQMIGFQCHIIIYWFSRYDFFLHKQNTR